MGRPRGPEASDILARMSGRAKEVEDAFAELADLTDTAAEERRQRAKAAADAAVKQMNQNVTTMKTTAAADWHAMQAGIDRELKEMEAQRAARKHERDATRAEQEAQAARERAQWAASYAAAAAQMATLAALDYDDARRKAEAIKR
jgi:hypothetical protein